MRCTTPQVESGNERGDFDGLAAVALAGPQHRFIITAKSSEKCPIWPPAPAARLTPHSAFTPCGDESLNISKICFSPRTDLRLYRPIEIEIEEVSRCCMGLYNEVARACGDQSTKSETSQ